MFMLRLFDVKIWALKSYYWEHFFFSHAHGRGSLLLSEWRKKKKMVPKKRARSDLHMRIFWNFSDGQDWDSKWNGMEWTDLSDEKCVDIKYTQLDTNVINDMIYAEHCAQKEEDEKERKKKHTQQNRQFNRCKSKNMNGSPYSAALILISSLRMEIIWIFHIVINSYMKRNRTTTTKRKKNSTHFGMTFLIVSLSVDRSVLHNFGDQFLVYFLFHSIHRYLSCDHWTINYCLQFLFSSVIFSFSLDHPGTFDLITAIFINSIKSFNIFNDLWSVFLWLDKSFLNQ